MWLITGGCGFIGANLADALLEGGQPVTLVDNLTRPGSRANLAWLRARRGQGWRHVELDLREVTPISKLVAETKPTVVAHMAGQSSVSASIADPRNDFDLNTRVTVKLLDVLRQQAPQAVFLYSSTHLVYGALDMLKVEETPTRYVLPHFPNGLDEELPLAALSPFGCSKLAAEQYALDYARTYRLRTVVFRHSAMFGPRQSISSEQGSLAGYCQKALDTVAKKVQSFAIAGNGKQVRDALHVDDFVSACLLAAAKPDAVAGRAFNLGAGPEHSFSAIELLAALEELCRVRLRYLKTDMRAGEQRVFVASNRAFSQATGWKPTIGMKDGLARTLQWMREAAAGESRLKAG
jgi:CDP-paratose 2-epimerase